MHQLPEPLPCLYTCIVDSATPRCRLSPDCPPPLPTSGSGLNNCKFTGSLPYTWGSNGTFPLLAELYLESNQLTGLLAAQHTCPRAVQHAPTRTHARTHARMHACMMGMHDGEACQGEAAMPHATAACLPARTPARLPARP